MSLVNDALKRAQDAQKKGQPAAPGPQFRPAEPAPVQKRGMGIWVPVVIALVAVAGLILVWQNRQKAEARQPLAEPKSAAPVATILETKPPVQPAVAPAPAPAPVPAAPAVAAETPAPAPVVSAPAPQLKLQAIFYAPGHSSAIINGKTVRVGDNFRGFRVAALTQTSATLVSATQTNVMTLEQE
jgi:hypothetical protein